MPLLDHFRPPLHPRRHWESFHVNWAGAIADDLNERLLPEGYFAEEHAQVEIDVATFAEGAGPAAPHDGSTAILPARVWTPPAPAMVAPAAFPDSFEVLVFGGEGGANLVAAVELVSPANKDREAHRRAFVIKCASYLGRGVGLVVIDFVTTRQAILHDETMALLGHGPAFNLPDGTALYAVAYRPAVRDGAEQIDIWPTPLTLGQELPVLPLALCAADCLPLDLETTYMAARRRRRLA
jgi:hypothetical protein